MNIIETLIQQRKGRMAVEASEKLAAVVKACRETGKKGKLTITLTVRPTATEMLLSDKVKPECPEAEAAATVFFDDQQGNLSRTDPHQQELPLNVSEIDQAANQ